MKNTTRRSLLASGLALVLCLALLLGATLAWFTDNVTSTGNTIQAGTLEISATVHELAASYFTSNEIEAMAQYIEYTG